MAVHKIRTLEEMIALRQELKASGRKLVLTNGCFDILHVGHVRYLQAARALGDALVVAINSDRSIKTIKGERRPIIPQSERAEIIAALAPVDYVIIFDETDPGAVIDCLLPDILVKGADWAPDKIIGRTAVEASGGTVRRIPVVNGASTSDIIRKVLERFG